MAVENAILGVDGSNVLRNADGREMRLYAITLEIPGRGRRETYHVLSYDEPAAVGMAELAARCDRYSSEITFQEYAAVKRWVVPVALTIQGWGKQQF